MVGEGGLSRRHLLKGAAASLFLASCGTPPPLPKLTGSLQGGELSALGHRLRQPFQPPSLGATPARARVVIVGGGVAGLVAAWRLRRAGVREGVVILELGAVAGGTSRSGASAAGAFPWGAHYITVRGAESSPCSTLLTDLGVITGFRDGWAEFDERALCNAPDERVFEGGRWVEGIWPETLATPEDKAQHLDFREACDRLMKEVGEDGRAPFALPLADSSQDPRFLAWDGETFASWLDKQGYTSPVFRWWAAYGCRDDFGTLPEHTSAWAGLHYHCARLPKPGDPRDLGTDVLTWPAGNGWLVGKLTQGLQEPMRLGCVVRALQPLPLGVETWFEEGGEIRCIHSEYVIAAVPARIADRLVHRPVRALTPDFAPWRVANLHVHRLPSAEGVSTAWDSVLQDSTALGYVTSSHQSGRYQGPASLTWYEPLTGPEPGEARRSLSEDTWESIADRALTDLSRAHSDLRSCVHRVDALLWGHGTVRPVPGLRRGGSLAKAALSLPRISFAHTDLSGVSLFEEAAWHGIRAAEEALATLGWRGASLL